MKKETKHTPERRTAEIDVSRIVESPWNIHGKKDDELDGLVESIKETGIVQRLTVRPIYKGDDRVTSTYELVDGHRRFAAAKRLKLKAVPCDMVELDDEQAQAATLAANIQRLDNDPLLEASLIEKMRKAGKTYAEIAAALGQSETHVVRRARLTALAECWRDEYAKAEEKPSIARLEQIAAYEPDLQEAAWKQLSRDGSDEVRFDDYYFAQAFTSRMRKLGKDAAFDTEKAGCRTCPYNTACHPDLFGMDEDEDDTPRCQNAECFARNWNTETDAKIEKLRKKGTEPVAVKTRYDVPNSWQATKAKTKTNTAPYVYEPEGLKTIVWSIPDQKETAPAKTEEEKAREKAEKRSRKLVKSAREKLRGDMRQHFKEADLTRDEYERLAAARLKREIRRGTWYTDDFVDDYAKTVDSALACLEPEEREAWTEATKGEEADDEA